MYIHQKSVVIICRVLRERTQNQKRSYVSICFHKDTGIEKMLLNYLESRDIVLSKYNTCIFVNGCFWHKHEGCKYFVWPKNNAEFWKQKIESTVERDRRKQEELEANGWKIIIIWEFQLKPELRDFTLKTLCDQLK